MCLELFFSFSFLPVSSVSLDGVFSVSLVLVVMGSPIDRFVSGRWRRRFSILLAVVLRRGGSLLEGTVVGCVYCMYVIGSFQMLVLITGGVELCSEEMTDDQGEL